MTLWANILIFPHLVLQWIAGYDEHISRHLLIKSSKIKKSSEMREKHIKVTRKPLLRNIRCPLISSFLTVCWLKILSGDQDKSFILKLFATKHVKYLQLICEIEQNLTLIKFIKWGDEKKESTTTLGRFCYY